MMTSKSMQGAGTAGGTENRRDYRLIFTAAFALFLVAGFVERLLARPLWSSKAVRKPKGSMFAQAKSSASIAASAGLMG